MMNVDAINTDNCTAFHATTMAVRAAGAGAYDAAEKTANGQDNLRLTGAWSDLTAFRHAYPLPQIDLDGTFNMYEAGWPDRNGAHVDRCPPNRLPRQERREKAFRA